MPIRDAECVVCGMVKEVLVKNGDENKPIPCECGKPDAEMRVISEISGAPGLQFKGRWFKNTGGY